MRQSRTDQAYKILYEQITRGQIAPNTALSEIDLAKSLEMSRTPVRDAVSRLVQDGLLERTNGRLTVVDMTYSRAADAFVARAAIEGVASRLACSTATPKDLESLHEILSMADETLKLGDVSTVVSLNFRFHRVIIGMSENPTLIAMSKQADAMVHRFRHISAANFGRVRQATASHKAILEAFQRRDADECERLMREDILGGGAALLKVMEVFFGIDRVTPSVSMVLRHAGVY